MSVIIEGKESYVGCVINTYECNGYSDSDFYATVINPEQGTIEDIEYDSTRHGGYGRAFVDVTRDNYVKYLHNARRTLFECYIDREARRAKEVTKGKVVKVVKGRNVQHGVVGELFWERKETYGVGYSSNRVTRIGIRDEKGQVHWTYAHNVQVVNYRQYMRSPQEIIKQVKQQMSARYKKFK